MTYGPFLSDQTVGYIASLLVLATFTMKSMRALRIVAIMSNIAFILYASLLGLSPILALHAMLLPLNLFRLFQDLHAASGEGARGESGSGAPPTPKRPAVRPAAERGEPFGEELGRAAVDMRGR